MNRDQPSASVPGTDKQVEADLWQRYGAKRGVWTEAMLIALERGKEGSSEWRPLGIPTVTDRVVQAALKMVMEPIFESGFAESSYG